MEHHRLLSPLKKIIQQGYNLAFLHGTGNRDCFYYDVLLGTLEASTSLKHFFLSDRMEEVEYFIQINDQKLLCFQNPDTDCTEDFFSVEQEPDDLDDITLENDHKKSDEAKSVEASNRENNTEFENNVLLMADKIKEKSGKTVVYFDNFEWTAGLYASNQDQSLALIKTIKALIKEKKAIVILNISDTKLLERFHFNLEESNNIFIGNPSDKEVKAAFFRKHLRENTQQSVQENLMTELDNISKALASSNKNLRGCLRIYNSVMSKSLNQVISKADFETAVEKILNEKISFQDVILNEGTKGRIIREVDEFLKDDGSKNYKKGLIFTGPPGTGKTHLAKALATERDCFFMSPTLSDLKGEFVGQTSGKVKRIFDQARANQPTILFIDEADTIFADRNSAGTTSDSFNLDMVNQFLVEIDGMTSGNQKIFVIAATNRIGFLDSAIRSRLSDPIEIPLPSKLERKELFHVKLQKKVLSFMESLLQRKFLKKQQICQEEIFRTL
ncbi:MAG: ATP-binding protein [Eubacteriales bacterium]